MRIQGRRFFFIIIIGTLCAGILAALGVFFVAQKNVDIELTRIEKSYRHGQDITLHAVLKTPSFRPVEALVNARIIGDKTDCVLKTYFPVLKRHHEYKFDFNCPVESGMDPGKYRFVVRVMTYGSGDGVNDIVSAERTFTVQKKRILSKKEIATREVNKAGKGIPLEGDLAIYPVESGGSFYGTIIHIGGVYKNITYWDGDFKLDLIVLDPAGNEKKYTDQAQVKSEEKTEFAFDYEITEEKPEGRYAITARLYNDQKGKKGYGKLLNEVASSFSVVDEKPIFKLDGIDLQVPGSGPHEFKVTALDDRGIKKVIFQYDLERKGLIKNVVTLKKKKDSNTVAMQLVTGDERNGVWMGTVHMPPEGSKFVFSLEAEDTKGQKVVTDRYPVSVIKAVKKKKEKPEEEIDMDIKKLPGLQGYNEWEY